MKAQSSFECMLHDTKGRPDNWAKLRLGSVGGSKERGKSYVVEQRGGSVAVENRSCMSHEHTPSRETIHETVMRSTDPWMTVALQVCRGQQQALPSAPVRYLDRNSLISSVVKSSRAASVTPTAVYNRSHSIASKNEPSFPSRSPNRMKLGMWNILY